MAELLLLLLLKTKEEFEAMEGGAFSLGQLNLGRVLINRNWQAAVGQLPLCPQKRTFVRGLSMGPFTAGPNNA